VQTRPQQAGIREVKVVVMVMGWLLAPLVPLVVVVVVVVVVVRVVVLLQRYWVALQGRWHSVLPMKQHPGWPLTSMMQLDVRAGFG
jgi:hypothetical protein